MKRRRFLQTVLGGVAAVAAARPARAAVSGREPEREAGRGGYRETEHVRRYYRTARF